MKMWDSPNLCSHSMRADFRTPEDTGIAGKTLLAEFPTDAVAAIWRRLFTRDRASLTTNDDGHYSFEGSGSVVVPLGPFHPRRLEIMQTRYGSQVPFGRLQ